jgi:hypothetical protein
MRTPFVQRYRSFTKANVRDRHFGFNLKTLANIEPVLAFLYEDWCRVNMQGLDRLPGNGPALVVGNAGGIFPWAALMLSYALLAKVDQPRRLHVLMDMDWIDDERLYQFLVEIGFVPWSADNAKKIFGEGDLAFLYPEPSGTAVRTVSERYRVRDFDWTRIMPAVEMRVPIYPMAATGPDEVVDVYLNFEQLGRLLGLPAFPVTSSFPWAPFPTNMVPRRRKWFMRIMKSLRYDDVGDSRDDLEQTCQQQSLFAAGEVQAEVNRMLRSRIKTLF